MGDVVAPKHRSGRDRHNRNAWPPGVRRIVSIILGTWIIVTIGTLGYVLIEHWDVVDALYMTVITLTTVGYGEVRPLSEVGRIFTTLLIVAGVGMLAYAASVVGAFFLDGTFTFFLRRRRLNKRIAKLDQHCIVCGYGRTGRQVVTVLEARGIPFVVIDQIPEKVESLFADGAAAIVGNAHDNEVLEEAGIARAQALIACASDDAENVFITLSARSMRPDLNIVARAEDQASEPKLRRAGAAQVVTPYVFAGDRLVAAAYRPSVIEFFDTHIRGLSGYDIREISVKEGASVENRTLAEIQIRPDFQTTVLAIRRADGTFLPNPSSDARLGPGDTLLGFGPVDKLEQLERTCQ
ncbi:MAG: potassium channel protein [Candidatus Eisenbacteria bacterium]|uniref:Potassium channel protein n=1 Tax=Eiseniibacteriota bacterium TaxID=2212470 RepID=A0A956RMJ7_UNCEI|nr:potassium channel protein [Candidatus Eisenbacteria bacterium]